LEIKTMLNLIFTRPHNQRIGQHFVNLTGYHGPGHSELFYEPADSVALETYIAEIIVRYHLTHWYTMPKDLWIIEATNYFTKAPWVGGVMANQWEQNGQS
jgi:hypothetical protein